MEDFSVVQRCAQLEHVVPNKAGASDRSHNTMQELLLLRQMPNPAPELSGFLRHFPRAASLERGSHGVISHTQPCEEKGVTRSYTNHPNYLYHFTTN